MTRLLFVSYIFHCFLACQIKNQFLFHKFKPDLNAILNGRRYVKLDLLIVTVSGDEPEVTSQCKPKATKVPLEVRTATKGRRQRRRLLVGVLHRLWRFIETNSADIDSSRPTTTLVDSVLSETASQTTEPGCWCSDTPSPPLPSATPPPPSLSFTPYALSVYGRCAKFSSAEIDAKPLVFGSIGFSAGQFYENHYLVYFQRFDIFLVLILSPSLTKLTKITANLNTFNKNLYSSVYYLSKNTFLSFHIQAPASCNPRLHFCISQVSLVSYSGCLSDR